MGTSFHDQAFLRHEILCRDNEPSYNDQPLSEHKTVCRDIELFSLGNLPSRPRNPLPRPNPVATQNPLSRQRTRNPIATRKAMVRHFNRLSSETTCMPALARSTLSWATERLYRGQLCRDRKALAVAIPCRDIEPYVAT